MSWRASVTVCAPWPLTSTARGERGTRRGLTSHQLRLPESAHNDRHRRHHHADRCNAQRLPLPRRVHALRGTRPPEPQQEAPRIRGTGQALSDLPRPSPRRAPRYQDRAFRNRRRLAERRGSRRSGRRPRASSPTPPVRSARRAPAPPACRISRNTPPVGRARRPAMRRLPERRSPAVASGRSETGPGHLAGEDPSGRAAQATCGQGGRRRP